ncbi:hypothetical protein P2318_09685 [Myxococcaceae bacterium GXIMD 01537]
MNLPVSVFLTPAEGLLGLLTRERLASFRAWFFREWTKDLEGGPPREEDLDEDLKCVLVLVDHLLQHGVETLRKPREEHREAASFLLDELADYFTRDPEEGGPEDRLELATAVRPGEQDLRAAEAVIGTACPERTQHLWAYLVWGRAPDWEEAGGAGRKRGFATLGYWTAEEVRQVRDDLREHLGGPPDYKPVRAMARFSSLLARLPLVGRGAPAPALDALMGAMDRASRQRAGLLFGR